MSVTVNGSSGFTFNDGSTQNTSPFTGGLGFRNRIINGDFRIDQRNAGAAAPITSTSSSNWGSDRFIAQFFGSSYPTGTFANIQQSTDAPAGFTHSLKVTAAQAVSFSSGGSQLGGWIQQNIEANNIGDFLEGSGITSFTIGFRVKASKVGVVSVSVECYDVGGSYCTTVNINQANTWEYKSVTIPAQNLYKFNIGNGVGLSFKVGLGSNTSWLVSTNNQWNNNSAARGVLSANQTNFLSSVNDYLAITGVQLEKGSTATSFDYRPYGTELALCQRYFQRVGSTFFGATEGSSTFNMQVPLWVPMRASSTVSGVSGGIFSCRYAGDTNITNPTLANATSTAENIWLQVVSSGLSSGVPIYGRSQNYPTSNFLNASAEL